MRFNKNTVSFKSSHQAEKLIIVAETKILFLEKVINSRVIYYKEEEQ